MSLSLVAGCGKETTTSTADNAAIATAMAGAMIMAGSSSVSTTAGDVGDAAGTEVTISSIKTLAGEMPSSFLITDMTNNTDGWLQVTANVIGGATPWVRMYTQGGDLINGAYLNGNKLAILGTFDWDDFFDAQGEPPGLAAGIQSFILNQTYYQITTMAEYMAWAFMADDITTRVQQDHPNAPAFSTPQATSANLIAAMHCKVVFSNGTVTFNITVDPSDGGGKPADATNTGSGSITVTYEGTNYTFACTMSVTFVDGDPTAMTLTGTDSATGYYLEMTGVPSTGVGSGTVYTDSTKSTVVYTFTCTSDSVTVKNAAGETVYTGSI